MARTLQSRVRMLPGTRTHTYIVYTHVSFVVLCRHSSRDYRYPIHGSHKTPNAVATELYEANLLEEMISRSLPIFLLYTD